MLKGLTDELAAQVLAPEASPALLLVVQPACGASYQAGQVLALLSEHHPTVPCYRVDLGTLAGAALASRIDVTAAPTVLLWQDGSERRRISGNLSADALDRLISDAETAG